MFQNNVDSRPFGVMSCRQQSWDHYELCWWMVRFGTSVDKLYLQAGFLPLEKIGQLSSSLAYIALKDQKECVGGHLYYCWQFDLSGRQFAGGWNLGCLMMVERKVYTKSLRLYQLSLMLGVQKPVGCQQKKQKMKKRKQTDKIIEKAIYKKNQII